MNELFRNSIELYKRGFYEHIPIGAYPDGKLFFPTKKQVRALELINDDTTTHIGYGGSARSGKSIIECTAILFDCFAYPGIAWGLGRLELKNLKKTVLLTLFEQMEFYEIGEDEYNYDQMANEVRYNNGSVVFLIDTKYKPSDPLNNKFGGFALTRVALDESNETNLLVVNKLFERTGWRKNLDYGLKKKIFETFNPDKNHVNSRYWIPFRDQKEEEHKKFIRALPSDNPHPSVKEWIDDIKKTGDIVTIERQINGNFDYDDDPAKLCDFDAINDLFTNDHVIPSKSPQQNYLSSDIALKGRDNLTGYAWAGNVATLAFDENSTDAPQVEMLIRQACIDHKIPRSNVIVDPAGVGGFVEGYLKGIKTFKWNLKGANKDKKYEYDNFKSRCGFYLAEMINERKLKIICSPIQREKITQEIQICLKQDNTLNDTKKRALIKKDKMAEMLGGSTDYLDPLIYRMHFFLVKNIRTLNVNIN